MIFLVIVLIVVILWEGYASSKRFDILNAQHKVIAGGLDQLVAKIDALSNRNR